METKSIVLAGVGGQGIILASKLIAQAAMEKGLEVRTAETIGMAQRGGSVVSHLRMGGQVASSLTPKGQADLILGFEPAEALRCLPYLKEGGTIVAGKKAIYPVTASLGTSDYEPEKVLTYLESLDCPLYLLDTQRACTALGSGKILNTLLLGAASACGALGIDLEELEKAVCLRVKPAFRELNCRALHWGAELINIKADEERRP